MLIRRLFGATAGEWDEELGSKRKNSEFDSTLETVEIKHSLFEKNSLQLEVS